MPSTDAEKHKLIAHHRGGLRAWFFWLVASFAYLSEFFLRDGGAVIERDLLFDLNSTEAQIGGAMASYLWAYALMQLIVGMLFDKYGTRKLLPLSMVTCAIGALVFSLSQNVFMLAVARILLGIGSAFSFVGAAYLATVWFPPSRLALVLGLTCASGTVGGILAQTPEAMLTEVIGWRWVFALGGVIALCIALFMQLVIPPRPSWFEQHFTDPDRTLADLGKSITRALSCRSILLGFCSGVLWFPVSVFAALWGVPYLQATLGLTPEGAGMGVIFMYVGMFLGSPLWGWISDLTGQRKWILFTGCLLAGVLSLLLLFGLPAMGVRGAFILLGLLGFCVGSQLIAFAIAPELNGPGLGGTSIAVNNFIVMGMGAAMMWGMGLMLDAGTGRESTAVAASSDAFRRAMFLLPISLFAGAAALLFVRTK